MIISTKFVFLCYFEIEEIMSKSVGSTWNLWDLHNHTDASDGKMTCEQLINAAIAKNIKCIAITDHHTAKNIDEARRIGKEKGIHVIAGIEFRTEYGQKSVQIGMLMPRLEGTNGVKKMSKSVGNYIGINEAPEEMYGKTMSIPDELIIRYFELVTDVHPDEIEKMKNDMANDAVNPRDLKMALAREI